MPRKSDPNRKPKTIHMNTPRKRVLNRARRKFPDLSDSQLYALALKCLVEGHTETEEVKEHEATGLDAGDFDGLTELSG